MYVSVGLLTQDYWCKLVRLTPAELLMEANGSFLLNSLLWRAELINSITNLVMIGAISAVGAKVGTLSLTANYARTRSKKTATRTATTTTKKTQSRCRPSRRATNFVPPLGS